MTGSCCQVLAAIMRSGPRAGALCRGMVDNAGRTVAVAGNPSRRYIDQSSAIVQAELVMSPAGERAVARPGHLELRLLMIDRWTSGDR